MKTIIQLLAEELGCKEEYVNNVVTLLDEGNTIPFIARYRKEAHGAMDDTALRTLETRLQYLRNLQQRRDEVKASIEAQGKLTDELSLAIDNAATLAEVEDLYRPYKQKRRTRATVAKEKGLEPLADAIFAQDRNGKAPEELAKDFLNPDLGVETIEDALSGASDIIAERISDDAELRKSLRARMQKSALCESKAAKEDEDSVYRLYYDFHQPVSKLQSHQVLALNRGEKEGYLKVALDLDRAEAMQLIRKRVVKPGSPAMAFLAAAAEDSYDRLLAPSMERELRTMLTDAANEAAIHNFALNLRPLLMQPPVKGFVTMGLDPGYRTGCKLAVVDPTGKVLDTAVIYPTKPREDIPGSARIVRRLIDRYHVDVVAIGNGTASKESEIFISDTIRDYGGRVKYAMVSEAGASVYSASKLAADEFPDFDVTQRSAVSIARRLQDPLAELVKIDPKSIGVGQYQHDMKPARLDEALGGVVEDCVNAVGVDLNTASHSLLSHISGINATAAKNIVKYREENGEFRNRAQLLKVPKIGAKAYEQAAGFLRVSGGSEILDNTGVHPESYGVAKSILVRYGFESEDVAAGRLKGLSKKIEKDIPAHCTELQVGEPPLRDIVAELEKPGRDVRDDLPEPELRSDLLDLADLKPGMKLKGVVRNVIDFGAFVDIGVHQDGLLHLSQISKKYIRHPSEVLSVGDRVEVTVLSVDVQKKRISLTMKQ